MTLVLTRPGYMHGEKRIVCSTLHVQLAKGHPFQKEGSIKKNEIFACLAGDLLQLDCAGLCLRFWFLLGYLQLQDPVLHLPFGLVRGDLFREGDGAFKG